MSIKRRVRLRKIQAVFSAPEKLMQISDHIDPAQVERRDAQLWILAMAMIAILATGIALMIYPAVFATAVTLSATFIKQVFVGFCGLSLLVIGYLMERRLVVRRLRKRIAEEQTRARRLLNKASADLLESLPSLEHFRDSLATEFRRAMNAQLPLSLALVSLHFSSRLPETEDILSAYGDAAKVMIRKLGGEDSIYVFRPGVFKIVRPRVNAADGGHVAKRLEEGLTDASGASERFSYFLRVVGFPENATSAHEMERAARSFSAEDKPAVSAA
jgi:hypothetical protein